MSGDLNRFNWLARHYNFLARLVFGKAIWKSQAHFLTFIPPGTKLLIVGGGSGEILPYLWRINPGCSIWYVEASSEMLAMASKKVKPEVRNKVNFIHGTEAAIPEGIVFDVIITHFFLDLFPNEKGLALCRNLYRQLQPRGLWLISDFVNGGKWWQRLMLWMMYRFFVVTCKIEATSLPSWESQLRLAGMREKTFKLFFRGFIKSAIYIRDSA
jgi:tRNA (cmo5U34)-methyltransferase